MTYSDQDWDDFEDVEPDYSLFFYLVVAGIICLVALVEMLPPTVGGQ